MKADLHCHSHYSDGQHPPHYLLREALANGLTHLAITDHDCIAAHETTDVPPGLSLITGVEISCAWEKREIHVVGLGINTGDSGLGQLLARQQASRRQRLAAFDDSLKKLGIKGLQAFVEELPCQAVTRSHVARFLVDNGHCKNMQKAFKKYLSRRGKIYVPASWCSLEDAVACINGAGGLAILAHPGRYPLSKRKLQTLLESFKSVGGEAMEVSYANIHPDMQRQLSDLASDNELFASQGSDFHDASAHWTAIGKFPSLGSQAQKNAIWLHPRWHFLRMTASECPKPAC